MFDLFQRMGFHVVKKSFYEPIPDTEELKDDLWNTRLPIGIDFKDSRQLLLLKRFIENYKKEYESIRKEPTKDRSKFFLNNKAFSGVDAQMLYCMIRYFKPQRIIEIGSGLSSLLIKETLWKNFDTDNITFTSLHIDPFPEKLIEEYISQFIIKKKVQDVELGFFSTLHANDILFIDSSHVVKIGSDVQYLILKVLQSLNKGVIIHFHDIFIPEEYPKEWVLKKHIFWNEQYMLEAFMSFNNSFEVLLAGNYLSIMHEEELEETFDSFKELKSKSGSFWIRKTK